MSLEKFKENQCYEVRYRNWLAEKEVEDLNDMEKGEEFMIEYTRPKMEEEQCLEQKDK